MKMNEAENKIIEKLYPKKPSVEKLNELLSQPPEGLSMENAKERNLISPNMFADYTGGWGHSEEDAVVITGGNSWTCVDHQLDFVLQRSELELNNGRPEAEQIVCVKCSVRFQSLMDNDEKEYDAVDYQLHCLPRTVMETMNRMILNGEIDMKTIAWVIMRNQLVLSTSAWFDITLPMSR